jgi:glycosyltransferase involved in cell wall biosynthesis
MRVSVICPTFNRPERHEQLYRVFSRQTWPDKELWVHDDSSSPSPFFSQPRDGVHYVHSPQRVSIGAKRNQLLRACAGVIIAHFDDDDWYSPDYLKTMVTALRDESLHFVKLSVWNALSEADGTFWQADTQELPPKHFVISSDKAPQPTEIPPAEFAAITEEVRERNLWGYGFSYVYRRAVGEQCPFLGVDFGEDFEFVKRVRRIFRVGHLSGHADKVVHTMHAKNTAQRIFPQTQLDAALIPEELRAFLPSHEAPVATASAGASAV